MRRGECFSHRQCFIILCVFLKRLLPLDGFKHKDYEDECMYVCMYVSDTKRGRERILVSRNSGPSHRRLFLLFADLISWCGKKSHHYNYASTSLLLHFLPSSIVCLVKLRFFFHFFFSHICSFAFLQRAFRVGFTEAKPLVPYFHVTEDPTGLL